MDINDFHPIVLHTGKADHQANWNWHNVCSPFSRIYCVASGSGTVEIAGHTHTLTPGHLYLIPAFVRHTTSCTDRFVHHYIHVYEEGHVPTSLTDHYQLPFAVEASETDIHLFERLALLNPTMVLPESNPKGYDNRHTLAQSILHNKQRSEWLKMESRGIVLQLFSRFVAQATPQPLARDPRIHHAIAYIHTHLAEQTTIAPLAHEACLSPEHFIRLFTQNIGYTPNQYINQKRIERAQLLLITTSQSVKEIALTMGYTDASYFVRAFKRITGLTPNKYRLTPQ